MSRIIVGEDQAMGPIYEDNEPAFIARDFDSGYNQALEDATDAFRQWFEMGKPEHFGQLKGILHALKKS